MIYKFARDWHEAPAKRVALFGMSGLGKTFISALLREQGNWFHYSVDYRIGTRYMGEHIVDNFKKEAMKTPFLAELLRSDSIYIASNITFNNLSPLSTYLGKPGDTSKGGILIDEYRRRQNQHHKAEVSSLLDTPYFIDRAQELYGYENFVCDTGGSICEVADPDDPNDPVMKTLAKHLLLVWFKGSEDHTQELMRRFDKAPKPMCYQKAFLKTALCEYLAMMGGNADSMDPDRFIRWTYARAMAHRQPIYARMAKWGITITAQEVAKVSTIDAFNDLIADKLC